MSRVYGADRNQVIGLFESGTSGYGNTITGSKFWFGLVQSHEVDENLNVTRIRYAGQATRNVGVFNNGVEDYTGTMNIFPQDWRMLYYVLGKCTDAGSPTPYTHTITEANSDNKDPYNGEVIPSFTIEDAHQHWIAGSGVNLVRTIKGCVVNNLTLNFNENEIVTIDVDYIAKNLTYSSGAITAITATTSAPYMSYGLTVAIPSGTSNVLQTVKSATVTIPNNIQAPHYAKNSKYIDEPIPTTRDYEVTLNTNADPAKTKTFYNSYFLGGSTFNMQLVCIAPTSTVGSRGLILTFSGCKLVDMSAPTPNEGINEQSLTVQPASCSILVNDDIFKYRYN